MSLFWILFVTKDTFYSFLIRVNQLVRRNYSICTLFHEKILNINHTVHENDVKLKDLGWKSAWCGDVITGFEHGGTVNHVILPKLTWLNRKIWNFYEFSENNCFLTENQNFGFETCIFGKNWNIFAHFGEFLSVFASKNRISCPFWQEKWHRENDLDWPFEFQAWFMVFKHDNYP